MHESAGSEKGQVADGGNQTIMPFWRKHDRTGANGFDQFQRQRHCLGGRAWQGRQTQVALR